MKKPRIISRIKINEKWVDQDELPADVVREIVENTIRQAGQNIGFEVEKIKSEKTA